VSIYLVSFTFITRLARWCLQKRNACSETVNCRLVQPTATHRQPCAETYVRAFIFTSVMIFLTSAECLLDSELKLVSLPLAPMDWQSMSQQREVVQHGRKMPLYNKTVFSLKCSAISPAISVAIAMFLSFWQISEICRMPKCRVVPVVPRVTVSFSLRSWNTRR